MTGVPKPDGRQTIMLSSDVPGKGKEAPPLVDFQLELNPLSKPWMDISVKTALQPMQITYDFVRNNIHINGALNISILILPCLCV